MRIILLISLIILSFSEQVFADSKRDYTWGGIYLAQCVIEENDFRNSQTKADFESFQEIKDHTKENMKLYNRNDNLYLSLSKDQCDMIFVNGNIEEMKSTFIKKSWPADGTFDLSKKSGEYEGTYTNGSYKLNIRIFSTEINGVNSVVTTIRKP